MPCRCGREVFERLERCDITRLTCKGCMQYVHSKCYKIITKAEHDLIKDDFTCDLCTKNKKKLQLDQPITPKSQKSLHDSSSVTSKKSAVGNVVGMIAVSNNNKNLPSLISSATSESANNINVLNANVDLNDAVTNTPSDRVGDTLRFVGDNSYTASKSAVNVVGNLLNNNINKVDDLFNSSGCEITTKMLFDELMKLKADNFYLKKSVAMLLDANNKLISKVESLECVSCHKSFDQTKETTGHKSPNLNAKPSKKSKAVASTMSMNNNAGLITQSKSQIVPINNNTVKLPEVPTSASFAETARSANVIAPLPTINAAVDPITVSSSPIAPKWTTVARNKKKKQSLIGTGANGVIGVVSKFKWLHISSFKNSVTVQDIIDFLSNSTKISANNLICFKLVKKDVDVSKLNFVNFKLGIVPDFYNVILSPALWPANVRVRPFEFIKTKQSLPTGESGPSDGTEPSASSASASSPGAFLDPSVVVVTPSPLDHNAS